MGINAEYMGSQIIMKVLASIVALVSAETFVIGGDIAPKNSEPHILSLQRRNSHFCGATLVSGTHGICASHCYYEASPVQQQQHLQRCRRSRLCLSIHPQHVRSTLMPTRQAEWRVDARG